MLKRNWDFWSDGDLRHDCSGEFQFLRASQGCYTSGSYNITLPSLPLLPTPLWSFTLHPSPSSQPASENACKAIRLSVQGWVDGAWGVPPRIQVGHSDSRKCLRAPPPPLKQKIAAKNKKCPCAELLHEKKTNDALSETYHQLARECELLMAKLGDRRAVRRVFYKCYNPTSLIGKIINRFSFGQNISHVSFIFPRPGKEAFVLWEVEALSKEGVVGHEHHPDQREGDYRYIDVTLEDYRKMMAAALSIVGKKYDKPGIWGMLVRKRREDPDKWFCSEALSWITKQGNNPLTHKPDYTVDPNDCWASTTGTPCTKAEVII